MKLVEELLISSRETASQLQNKGRELTDRGLKQSALWEANAPKFHNHEAEYLALLRAVTSTKEEINGLLRGHVEEQKRLQHLRSETSKRDEVSMLSVYKQIRAFYEQDAEFKSHLRELNQGCEIAVQKLEEFVEQLVGRE
jgi:hypothetical protein